MMGNKPSFYIPLWCEYRKKPFNKYNTLLFQPFIFDGVIIIKIRYHNTIDIVSQSRYAIMIYEILWERFFWSPHKRPTYLSISLRSNCIEPPPGVNVSSPK